MATEPEQFNREAAERALEETTAYGSAGEPLEHQSDALVSGALEAATHTTRRAYEYYRDEQREQLIALVPECRLAAVWVLAWQTGDLDRIRDLSDDDLQQEMRDAPAATRDHFRSLLSG